MPTICSVFSHWNLASYLISRDWNVAILIFALIIFNLALIFLYTKCIFTRFIDKNKCDREWGRDREKKIKIRQDVGILLFSPTHGVY